VKETNGRPYTKKCGAKTRAGVPCQNWGMRNGRCRMHGGKSTGPRTSEGIERIRAARWKTGRYSKEAREKRREVRLLLCSSKTLIRRIFDGEGTHD
jgi:hypothetical protein